VIRIARVTDRFVRIRSPRAIGRRRQHQQSAAHGHTIDAIETNTRGSSPTCARPQPLLVDVRESALLLHVACMSARSDVDVDGD